MWFATSRRRARIDLIVNVGLELPSRSQLYYYQDTKKDARAFQSTDGDAYIAVHQKWFNAMILSIIFEEELNDGDHYSVVKKHIMDGLQHECDKATYSDDGWGRVTTAKYATILMGIIGRYNPNK